MDSQSFIIETHHVTRIFPVEGSDSFYALKDVSIRILKEHLTILRGKSGSGKTTLINMLGALDEPTTGQVFFDGVDLASLPIAAREQLRRRKMGFIFQSVSLIPMMTVYENVEFALRLSDPNINRKERVEECLELVGLKDRLKHMPQELSGGEQQRVAIARAIAHRPPVIFADEPTAELDSSTSMSVIKTFKELVTSQKITIVMTTHDTALMGSGDIIYTLQDGSICEEVANDSANDSCR